MREVVEIQGLGNERRGSLPDHSLLGNNPEFGQMQPAMQPISDIKALRSSLISWDCFLGYFRSVEHVNRCASFISPSWVPPYISAHAAHAFNLLSIPLPTRS